MPPRATKRPLVGAEEQSDAKKKRSTRQSNKSKASMNEVVLAPDIDPDVLSEGEFQEQLRRRYDLFDTDLLWAWLYDCDDGLKATAGVTLEWRTDREKILTTLVSQHRIFPHVELREADSFWLAQLRKAWSHYYLEDAIEAGTPLPGRVDKRVLAAAPPGHRERKQEETEEKSPTEAGATTPSACSITGSIAPLSMQQQIAAAGAARAQIEIAVRAEATRLLEIEERRLLSPPSRKSSSHDEAASFSSPPAAAAHPTSTPIASTVKQTLPARGAPPADTATACLTCSTPHPSTSMFAPPTWLCQGCGLRGDLPLSSEENRFLQSRLQKPASSASASADRPHDIAPSQSAETRHRNAIDRTLAQTTADGVAFPIFTPRVPEPPPDALVKEALDQGRKAVGAAGCQFPSDTLLACIQSGKFTQLGWAIPRRIGALPPAESTRLSVDGSGSFQMRHSDGPPVPALASLADFMEALVSTILPALIGRPAAASQWLSLSRSVIEVERRTDWANANRYLTHVLYERVRLREEFAPLSQATLDLPRYSGPAASDLRRQQPEQRQLQRPSGDRSTPLCVDFNRPPGCSYLERKGEKCRFQHVCSICGSAHPATQCTKTQASRPAPGVPSGGEGRRRPPPAKVPSKVENPAKAE
jgi:hypothetical protein